MKYVLAIFGMILLHATSVFAQPSQQSRCGSYDQMITHLHKLGERLYVSGDAAPETGMKGRIEIWSRPDGKDWTLLAVDPDSIIACMMIIGNQLKIKPLGNET